MTIWRVKKAVEGKVRARHPWVFSNDLMFSPKGVLPGDPIELQDERGNFLARGYGNPNSQIAFRALCFEKKIEAPHSLEFIQQKIVRAWKARQTRGFSASYRVVFSEADELPGLILDRYLLENGQCLSVQINTAGMEKIIGGSIVELLRSVVLENQNEAIWQSTTIIVKNTSSGRKQEGLTLEKAVLLKDPHGLKDHSQWTVQLENLNGQKTGPVIQCDLLNGQKTGLFLDQSLNIRLLLQAIQGQLSEQKNFRILDLCCYMGQWSTYIAQFLLAHNKSIEVVLVDVSDLALEMAKTNLESLKKDYKESDLKITVLKCDVLDVSDAFKEQIGMNSYDIVISDPPAFVKNKKSLETGLHGYMKLNDLAFKWAKPNSWVVSCTCSGLVELRDFKNSLKKALLRSGKSGQIVAIGGQGADHPQNIHFPEGEYLKMVLHHLY